jgi:uncharacterized protein
MKFTSRNIHRDIAYFYIGLIIAFSFSGIFLNHRKVWHPKTYKYSSKEVKIKIPENKAEINDQYIADLTSQWKIKGNLKGFRIDENILKVRYDEDDAEIDILTGEGKLNSYRITPILGHFTKLHVDTSDFWIYYSDIFGVAMLIIAFTGLFIAKGENSFWKRGWKLALPGIIFPLIFLFLLS